MTPRCYTACVDGSHCNIAAENLKSGALQKGSRMYAKKNGPMCMASNPETDKTP